MGEFAVFRVANAGIAEIRALMNMAFGTCCSVLTISIDSEGATNQSARRDANMAVAAVLVRAVALGEMHASRRTLWSQFMRKIA